MNKKCKSCVLHYLVHLWHMPHDTRYYEMVTVVSTEPRIGAFMIPRDNYYEILSQNFTLKIARCMLRNCEGNSCTNLARFLQDLNNTEQ